MRLSTSGKRMSKNKSWRCLKRMFLRRITGAKNCLNMRARGKVKIPC